MIYKTKIEDIELSLVPFANQQLIYFDAFEYEPVNTVIGSVDLSKVAGCTHPDYSGKTWGDLKPVIGTLEGDPNDTRIAYQNLKRARLNCLLLSKNPEYYIDGKKKYHWSFYAIQDSFYISEGCHRTVIGRYFLWLNNLPSIVHGVEITHLKKPIN